MPVARCIGGAAVRLACLTAVALGSPEPAFAIPSPELVVSSLSSLSQIGAVVSALLGGGTMLALGKRGRRAGGDAGRLKLAVVALLLSAAALAAFNVYQWRSSEQSRQERLSATLTRPARFPGQKILDPTLKELGADEQAHHPLGLTAAEAEAIIPRAAELGYEVLDIREAGEVEMGTFNNATPIRFPDLKTHKLDLKGKKALLICHNGNRSSETCQALSEQGIDCRFIVGGLERWITEGRKAAGFYRQSILEARALPDYPNQRTLIDTPEARDLIEREHVAIVDVRYPGEFELSHLPGAINVPLRRLTTAEIDATFDKVPKGPAMIACYDRRGCFFGEIAGLILSRKGFDYRGRYTLPWEYAPKPPVPPQVAAALAERDMSSWARAERWLARELGKLALAFGFLPVLVGLALLNRLLILPFALKADRDQMKALEIEPELAELQSRLADDPSRRARALSQLYASHGMTPVRNLFALAALPMLMLASGALAKVAEAGNFALPVVGQLGTPDAVFLLPALAAALIGLYVDWTLCRTTRQSLITWLVGTPILLATLALLPGAVNFYVSVSILLLLFQRAALVFSPIAALRRRLARTPGRLAELGILRLADAAARPGVGNKAQRLGAMQRAGLPVPRGLVLTPEFVQRWQNDSGDERERLTSTIARAAGRVRVAVRSSAAAEDLEGASHAGIYESVTNVGREELGAAISRVIASFSSAKAQAYGGADGQGAVIVQQMIEADSSGVLFTRAPDAPGLALLERVDGAAEGLVSGRLKPQSFRFGRHSGALVGDTPAPAYASRLLDMARRIEALFGAPQDIEWVATGRRLAIVQSRDITADAAGAPPCVLAEWERALALAAGSKTAPALESNEMCAMLPRPTPATRSLIEALHASGGSVDLACRELGLAYRVEEEPLPLFPSLFGRLYHNAEEARRRAPRISRLDIRRVLRQAESIERRWRGEVAPETEARLELPAAAHFDGMETGALIRAIASTAERFVTDTHVEAEIINIAAEIVVGEARARLAKAGDDPAQWLVPATLSLFDAALAAAASAAGEMQGLRIALPGIGHRAALDYELAAPRYAEDQRALSQLIAAHRSLGPRDVRMAPDAARLPKRLARLVDIGRRLQVLKEDAKHVSLIELAVLRRALLALDRRLGLDGRIFMLSLQEIGSLDATEAALAPALTRSREAEAHELEMAAVLAPALTLEAIERSSWPKAPDTEAANDGALRGTRVAGTRAVGGKAYLASLDQAERGAPLEDFAAGDILVAPFVHPAWLGEVLRSAGVVAGSGGWLSHMAIVARERDIAMVTGVEAWASVPHGAHITLVLDGGIEVEPPVAPDAAPGATLGAEANDPFDERLEPAA